MRLLAAKKEKQDMQQIITATSTPQESPEPIRATTTEPVAEEAKQTSAQVKTLEIVEEAIQTSRAIRPEIRPHAFVVMPFGKKKGAGPNGSKHTTSKMNPAD